MKAQTGKKKTKKVENPKERKVRINTDFGHDLFLDEVSIEAKIENWGFQKAQELTRNWLNDKKLENTKEMILRRKKLERNESY